THHACLAQYPAFAYGAVAPRRYTSSVRRYDSTSTPVSRSEALLLDRFDGTRACFDGHAACDAGCLAAIRRPPTNQHADLPGRINVQPLRLGVQCVSAEQPAADRDVIEAEDGAAATIGLAGHADQPLQCHCADHQRALPRGGGGIMRIEMHRA